MAETDTLIATRLRNLSGHPEIPAWAKEIASEAATALTERAAQIERLTREKEKAVVAGWKAAHDCILYAEANNYGPRSDPYTAAELAEMLRDEAPGDYLHVEWRTATQAAEAVRRATTAERERDEARAEVERLRELFRSDGEQHAQFVKNLTKAHEDRITKYANAFNEIRAEVERKDAALLRIAERCRRPDLVARAALEEEGKP